MSAKENKAKARGYIEQVWNGHRIDLLAEFIAKEGMRHTPPSI